MRTRFITCLLSLLCVASCRTTMMGPTTILSADVENLQGATVGTGRVSATATEHSFLLSHIVWGEAAPQEAFESALKQAGPGCIGLSESFVCADFVWWIPLLYTHYTYTVEGSPIYQSPQSR